MKSFVFFFTIIFCIACNQNATTADQPSSIPDSLSNKDTATTISATVIDTYAIRLHHSGTLHLQQWDSTIDLKLHLGKPLMLKIRQLDRNSDTFSGSFIKDMVYDGLQLQLFSPPQNGKTFWVQEIILTNDKYKTTKGITIGDEWEKVKASYPSIQKFPGANENMYYVSDAEKSIEMEFAKNKLKKLRMYYTLN